MWFALYFHWTGLLWMLTWGMQVPLDLALPMTPGLIPAAPHRTLCPGITQPFVDTCTGLTVQHYVFAPHLVLCLEHASCHFHPASSYMFSWFSSAVTLGESMPTTSPLCFHNFEQWLSDNCKVLLPWSFSPPSDPLTPTTLVFTLKLN